MTDRRRSNGRIGQSDYTLPTRTIFEIRISLIIPGYSMLWELFVDEITGHHLTKKHNSFPKNNKVSRQMRTMPQVQRALKGLLLKTDPILLLQICQKLCYFIHENARQPLRRNQAKTQNPPWAQRSTLIRCSTVVFTSDFANTWDFFQTLFFHTNMHGLDTSHFSKKNPNYRPQSFF